MTKRPSVTVDILFEESGWGVDDLPQWAGRAWAALAALGHVTPDQEAALLACSDARIAELNADFRAKAGATNVLSWPSSEIERDAKGVPQRDDPDPFLGDLAIAFETSAREAEEAGVTLEQHTTHLIIHGLLHLLGYDHENDVEAHVMEEIEISALASLGIANPY